MLSRLPLLVACGAVALALHGPVLGQVVTGAGNSVWTITNSGGTSNGLPVGGFCDGSPGLAIEDASVGDQGDAFDNGLCTWINGQRFVAPGALLSAARPNGTLLQTSVASIGGLDVYVKYFFATTGDRAIVGTYLGLFNPNPTSINTTIVWGTNVGSDAQTAVLSTSSGDDLFTTADHWIVTGESGSSGPPRSTHVIGGGGPLIPSGVSLTAFDCQSTDGVLASFEFFLHDGQNIGLVYVNEITRGDMIPGDPEDLAGFMYGTFASEALTRREFDVIVNWLVPSPSMIPLFVSAAFVPRRRRRGAA